MTLRTNARLAGVAFLFYIAAGIVTMGLGGGAPVRELSTMLTSLCALVLGVTLFALTRVVDADLALLALVCRVVEAIPGRDGAFFFAIGSTIFAWLFVRGRLVPAALAWLGVAASLLIVIVFPLQRAGVFGAGGSWASAATWIPWMPMLVFEVTLAFWLLIKGTEAGDRG